MGLLHKIIWHEILPLKNFKIEKIKSVDSYEKKRWSRKAKICYINSVYAYGLTKMRYKNWYKMHIVAISRVKFTFFSF